VVGRHWWTPWLWLSPALLLVTVFLLYPSVDTVRRSLLDAKSEDFVGLDNYQFIVDNPNTLVADTHQALWNNLLWLILFPLLTVPIGLLLAMLTSRIRYEPVAKAAVFVPMAISFVAAAVIWRFIYEFNPEIGTANAVLGQLGSEPIAWLQDRRGPWGLITGSKGEGIGPLQLNNVALIIVGVWMWTGFAMVVLSAGLKGIATDIMEAARVDGANEWQIFARVIAPLLTPTIVVVTTTLIIQGLKKFDLVWVITGGRFGTDVVATLFFKEAFVIRNFGVGAALAIVLLAWVVPLMIISIRRFQLSGEAR
jgi:alpha-glucoside transport system permease protein